MSQKVKQRGSGYSGLDSTRPTQPQESDLANEGGTAPGGIVAFEGAASQWSTSAAANRNNFPTPEGQDSKTLKAALQHSSENAVDGAPDVSGNVPIHPGLRPGLFRTARDANYPAPDGKNFNIGQGKNDPTANDGHPSSPGGRHRGESPEVLKQTRGDYRP